MANTQEEQKSMVNVLKEKRFFEAFHLVTQCNWWNDNRMTNDTERENFLYKTYFDYYHLLFTEGVRGIDAEDAHVLMHQIKLQLDIELTKIKKGIYTTDDEETTVERYKVIKEIRKDGKVLAKVGEYLTVQKNPDRLYGICTLMRGVKRICDVGSPMAKEHCIKAYD